MHGPLPSLAHPRRHAVLCGGVVLAAGANEMQHGGESGLPHARLEAKKRLRMILVADRCAMSGRAMAEMKRQIVDVVQTFVDVDEEAGVEMSTTQDPGSSGTLYSVSIPVRGVKPQFDVENETYGWDEEPADAPYDDDAWAEAAEAAETSETK